jgi:F-type H+-transporting ATPase subunit b
MDILHQLGELFLDAVPTIVIVLLFYLFLQQVFFTPIRKVMAERNARIEGARAEAIAVEAAAKQATHSYEEALKKAYEEIFGEQEAARQAVLDERARHLKTARARAQEKVDAAKKEIAAELEAARAEVERQTPALADLIAQIILEKPLPAQGGALR